MSGSSDQKLVFRLPARWGMAAGLLLAFVWAAYRVGIQTSVALSDDAARARAWPNPELGGLDSYTRTSPVGPLLYQATGSESTAVYLAIHVLVGIAAISLLAWWVSRVVTCDSNRARAARLVILSPVAGMIFLSLGNYDPFTLLFLTAALGAWWYSLRSAMLLSGVLLGFQHFEQGLVAIIGWAVAAVALSDFLHRPGGNASALWILPGVITGKALLSLILLIQEIDPGAGRSAYFTDITWPRMAVTASINHFPVLLMSIFAGLWGVVLFVFFRLSRNSQRALLLAAMAIPTLASITTLAQSRVFVMTTVPILMLIIIVAMSDSTIAHNRAALLTIEGLAWVIVPLHLYVSTSTGQALLTTTNSLDFLIMFWQRLISLA